jgi:hypothetical protein
MPNKEIINFNSGLLSPQIDDRTDTDKYSSGCRVLENMFPEMYGCVEKRTGTQFIQSGNGSGCYYLVPPLDPTYINISNATQLAKIGVDVSYPVNGKYQLTNDIDCSGITNWTPLCNPTFPFSGTFNGRYYTIKNVTMSNVSDAGLFRSMSVATIENLTINNINFNNCFILGMLCNTDSGNTTLTNVHVNGSVSSNQSVLQVGGLFYTTNSNLSLCSCNVSVTYSNGDLFFGGLCYSSGGNITNCFSRGSVTYTGNLGDGMCYTGGLVGTQLASGKIYTNCYSSVSINGKIFSAVGKVAGFVGNDTSISDSYVSNYWDGDIQNAKDGSGNTVILDDTGTHGDVVGINKSHTSDMYKQSTYVGWDFQNIWNIHEGQGYPIFKWIDKVQTCTPIYA